MKRTFGDKTLREKMLLDPLLKGKWDEKEVVHALNPTDHLIAKVGIGIVTTVERYYEKYRKNPTPVTAKAYCLWRLRLHRQLDNNKEILEKINEAKELGLNDTEPGNTCWDLTFN